MSSESSDTKVFVPTWDGLLAERLGPRLGAVECTQRELARLQAAQANVTERLTGRDLACIRLLGRGGGVPAIALPHGVGLAHGVQAELGCELTARGVPNAACLARDLAAAGRAGWLLDLTRSHDVTPGAIEWLAIGALIEVSSARLSELLTGIARLRGMHRGAGPLAQARPNVDVTASLRDALDLFRFELESIELELKLGATPPVIGFPDELTDGFALLVELCLRAGAERLAVDVETTGDGDISVGIAGFRRQPGARGEPYDSRKFALAERLIAVSHDGRLGQVGRRGLAFWAWLPSQPQQAGGADG